MSLSIVQALHRIEAAMPNLWWTLLLLIVMLVTWRVTVAICRYDQKKYLLQHGDQELAETIRGLRAELKELQGKHERLRLRYQDRDAQIRQAQLLWGRASGKIQKAVLAQAAKTEELVGDQVGQMHEVLSAAPKEG